MKNLTSDLTMILEALLPNSTYQARIKYTRGFAHSQVLEVLDDISFLLYHSVECTVAGGLKLTTDDRSYLIKDINILPILCSRAKCYLKEDDEREASEATLRSEQRRHDCAGYYNHIFGVLPHVKSRIKKEENQRELTVKKL